MLEVLFSSKLYSAFSLLLLLLYVAYLVRREEFERITEGLADALEFSRTIGAGEGVPFEKGGPKGVHGEVDFYTRCATLSRSYWP